MKTLIQNATIATKLGRLRWYSANDIHPNDFVSDTVGGVKLFVKEDSTDITVFDANTMAVLRESVIFAKEVRELKIVIEEQNSVDGRIRIAERALKELIPLHRGSEIRTDY